MENQDVYYDKTGRLSAVDRQMMGHPQIGYPQPGEQTMVGIHGAQNCQLQNPLAKLWNSSED